MGVKLDHTIVSATDKHVSARFLADILGIEVAEPWGPFAPVALDNGAALDFVDAPVVDPRHYAFLLDGDDAFDAAFGRIERAGLDYYADPFLQRPGEVNHNYGGRGVYFHDPDGHLMEIMTAPYGDVPAGA
jgi:catechol 2,3-dioxygenase-like lactoylglutathione lyase family enzyme